MDEKTRTSRPIMRVIDTFSGAGGASIGYAAAGLQIATAAEIWSVARENYTSNLNHPCDAVDMSNIDACVEEFKALQADVFAGSPPCQNFSSAGPRREGKKAALTIAFATIIARLGTPWIIMENVPEVLESDAYEEARDILTTAGYGLTEAIINAANAGVPQRRLRLVMIGRLGQRHGFARSRIDRSLSHTEMTVREAFGGLPPFEHYYRHPRTYGRRAIFSVDEPSPTIRGVNRPVPPKYARHPGDTTDPKDVRAMSARERAIIQTFPADYQWKGGKGEIDLMIGNAFPPKLAEFASRHVVEMQNEMDNGTFIAEEPEYTMQSLFHYQIPV